MYKGFLLTLQKMIWVILTNLQLLRFKANSGPKICTEDVKKKDKDSKLQSLKDWRILKHTKVVEAS